MGKKDEFKEFVSKHPNLVNIVKNKSHTWQDLFEVYDLYGPDETAWNRYIENSSGSTTTESDKNSNSLGELAKIFKNVNIDNVQKYIDTAQKAIGVIQEITGASASAVASKGPSASRPINKIFED